MAIHEYTHEGTGKRFSIEVQELENGEWFSVIFPELGAGTAKVLINPTPNENVGNLLLSVSEDAAVAFATLYIDNVLSVI